MFFLPFFFELFHLKEEIIENRVIEMSVVAHELLNGSSHLLVKSYIAYHFLIFFKLSKS